MNPGATPSLSMARARFGSTERTYRVPFDACETVATRMPAARKLDDSIAEVKDRSPFSYASAPEA